MSDPTRIEDIQERVRDFVKALRRANAEELAKRIEGHTAGFTDAAEVRRAVAAVAQQLEYWRAHPNELPDLPIIHVAANRLEDVCRAALRGGVITAARPSLRARGKRNLVVALTALAAGSLMFLVPLVITMFGIDLTDPHVDRETRPIRVPQGEEGGVEVNVLVETAEPAVTRGVEFHIDDRCRSAFSGGATCRQVEPHEFSDGSLPTVEVMLPEQAYGLLVAFANQRVVGRVGSAVVRVAASDDTPEGRYRLPLSAAFIGYTPEQCSLVERLRDKCTERRVGDDALHDGLPVPTVVVDVVRGDPARRLSDQKKREAAAEALKKKAEERAAQMATAVAEIKRALDDTSKLLRKKQFERAKERIDKLAELFAPLDTLMVDDVGLESIPVEVTELRVRFDKQREELSAFEARVFDGAYALFVAEENKTRGEEELLAEVARNERISPDYAATIFAAYAEEMEKRLALAAEQRMAAERAAKAQLEARCGPLPTGAWTTVNDYLRGIFPTTRVVLGECMTPRLDNERCWMVTCDFRETIVTPDSQPDIVNKRRWTFLLRANQIAGVTQRLISR